MSIIQDYTTSDLDDMSVARNYNAWIIELIQPYIKDNILEIGAGSGNFTKSLLEWTGADVLSIEPMDTTSKLWMQNYETWDAKFKRRVSLNKCFVTELEEFITADTIIYNNVLEHIKNDVDELKAASRHLTDDGHVVVYSPALPVLMSDFDRSIGHYHRYTKHSICRKVEQAGLEVVTFRYVDMLGVLLWFLKFKLFKSKTLGNKSVRLFDKFLVPVQKNIESLVIPPIGKNVLCVARKR